MKWQDLHGLGDLIVQQSQNKDQSMVIDAKPQVFSSRNAPTLTEMQEGWWSPNYPSTHLVR